MADRVYSSGLPLSAYQAMNRLRFAAAVPVVGFVHGPAGPNPLDAGGFEPGLGAAGFEDGEYRRADRLPPWAMTSRRRSWPWSLGRR